MHWYISEIFPCAKSNPEVSDVFQVLEIGNCKNNVRVICSYYCVLVSRIPGILYVKQNSSIRLLVRTRLQIVQVHDWISTDNWSVNRRENHFVASVLTYARISKKLEEFIFIVIIAQEIFPVAGQLHIWQDTSRFLCFFWQSFSSCLSDRHLRPDQL